MTANDHFASIDAIYRRYAEIHGEVYNLRALIPFPWFFRRLDFPMLAHRLGELESEAEKVEQEVRRAQAQEPPWTKEPYGPLLEFCTSLVDTARRFRELLAGLGDVVRRKKGYRWFGRDYDAASYLASRDLCRNLRKRARRQLARKGRQRVRG